MAKPTLVEPDYWQIAWQAQARWLNERTPESCIAFERALAALRSQTRLPDVVGGSSK